MTAPAWLKPREASHATKTQTARRRYVEAKRDLVVEAAIAWVMGCSEDPDDEDTEAALIGAVEALLRTRGPKKAEP